MRVAKSQGRPPPKQQRSSNVRAAGVGRGLPVIFGGVPYYNLFPRVQIREKRRDMPYPEFTANRRQISAITGSFCLAGGVCGEVGGGRAALLGVLSRACWRPSALRREMVASSIPKSAKFERGREARGPTSEMSYVACDGRHGWPRPFRAAWRQTLVRPTHVGKLILAKRWRYAPCYFSADIEATGVCRERGPLSPSAPGGKIGAFGLYTIGVSRCAVTKRIARSKERSRAPSSPDRPEAVLNCLGI